MLTNLKLLLGISSNEKDSLLNLIISQVEADAKAYTHIDDLTDLESVMLSMCVYRYNQLGAENLATESYSGVSFNYLTDYPAYIIRQLQSFRHIRVVGNDN